MEPPSEFSQCWLHSSAVELFPLLGRMILTHMESLKQQHHLCVFLFHNKADPEAELSHSREQEMMSSEVGWHLHPPCCTSRQMLHQNKSWAGKASDVFGLLIVGRKRFVTLSLLGRPHQIHSACRAEVTQPTAEQSLDAKGTSQVQDKEFYRFCCWWWLYSNFPALPIRKHRSNETLHPPSIS